MILFKKLRYKNLLSSGNHVTELELDSHKTNLIVGKNGNGKSLIIDALCFSLYGRAYRNINKSQLVNSVNEKDCRVEVELTTGTTDWKIVRGIKPTIFEIWKNGNLLDQISSSLDQQKWLEQNVLKMNYKAFTQIVILGSSVYVPFMQLSTSNRREVIEELLDIKIFSSMNLVIKEKIREIKDDLKVLELKKQTLIEKVEMQQSFIDQLENKSNDNIKKKRSLILTLDKEVETYMRENGVLEESIFEKQKYIQEFSGYKEKLKNLANLKGKMSNKIEISLQDYNFFSDNTVCPTCTQTIDESFRLNKVQESQNKAKELQSGFQELKKLILDEELRENQFLMLSKEISRLTNDVSQNNIKISGCQRQIRNLEQEIQTITEQFKNKSSESKKLKSYKETLNQTYEKLSSQKELIRYYDFSYSLLKDGGVKTKIIKKYLPLINQQVNRYLQMMDFYINFVLNDEFKESIQSPIHEDFSYESFSEGEKAKINLSLIFAWREVARIKNSVHCNLIFFDEVFDSSLDSYGTDDFLKIIRYVIKDANIFVISHKVGLEDKFDRVFRVEKIKGFSKLSQI